SPSPGTIRMALIGAPLPVFAAAWGLAEYFCGRRRLLLPSMLLSVVACACAGVSVVGVFAPIAQMANAGRGGDVDVADVFRDLISTMMFAGFAASALAALAIFVRFRLPFALLLLALSLAAFFYTAVARFGDLGMIGGGGATLLAGVATLAAGVWFD